MRELHRNAHSVFLMHYHLVLVVKYRRKVIDDEISARLREIFEYIAPNYGLSVEEWNHDKDHIHVLFTGQPKSALSKFINAYKSASSRLINSLALCNAQLNLNKAFENHRKNAKHFGKPRFKSKKNRQSYSTNNQKGSVRIESGQIKLPKVGWVKIKAHRQVEGTIKTVTISKTPSGKYFVSILTEYENQVLQIVPKIFVGLDYAMNGFFVASTGERALYPRYYRRAQKKLRRVQKKFSRSKRESQNRERCRVALSLVYEKVTNRRKDFLQKLSTKLVKAYDAIAIEDLDLQSMAKRKLGGRFSFGKSISDNGWAMFTQMLEYKLKWQGKTLVKIDKWYPSSQLCSECSYQNLETKNLSVREWTCPKCGAHHDRDHNAAINIKNEGMRILA